MMYFLVLEARLPSLKFLVVFGQYKVLLDIVVEAIFLQNLNVRNEVNNCRILKLPY
jgi:hypothetical protein